MRSNGRMTGIVAGLLVVLGGCAADDGAGEAADAVQVESPAATETAAPSVAPALGDPEIAHVAVTANAIDVELAEVALERAGATEVRDFARTMIADHTAVNERAGALAQRLGVTPRENAISASLQSEADAVAARLTALSGADFDRAYIEREVAYHQAVLDALDQTLIPSAANPELAGLLREVRPAIAAHLARAQSIQASLRGS